ncbi:MAG: hypothetical protein EON93_14920 [Burkholderiales bacterium]|nr:MAG: hypothetical protein EON93_14920 [Burkholderiales bacterium]
MCEQQRRKFLAWTMLGASAIIGVSLLGFASAQTPDPTGKKWVCPPCGCGQDGKEFDAEGPCPACGMPMIEKTAAKPSPADKHDHPEAAPAKSTGTATPATPSTVPAVSSPRPQ